MSDNQLNELDIRVQEYLANNENTQVPLPNIDIKVNDFLLPPNICKPKSKLFLKPIGSSDEPIYEGDFADETAQFFSKKRPASVAIGDLLISYGVGSTKLISVFKVTSVPCSTGNENDRWPWYVKVENLTPIFGGKWFKYNDLHLSKLVADYLSIEPDCNITHVGGKTLGALQWGIDKIRLDESFGIYLLQQIFRYEKQ